MPEVIQISTRQRSEMLEITRQVQEAVTRLGVSDGVCVVYVPHTTAGVCINENADPDVRADVTKFLSGLIPKEGEFQHFEGNSDSHIKSIMTGASAQILVENGRLLLGRWQGIYFAEYDGPRHREVWIKTL